MLKTIILKPKLLLIFVIALSYNSLLQAQTSLELSGGVNYNSITFSAKDRVYTEYNGDNGKYIKLGVDFPIYKNINLYAGITYLNKNYRYERTGPYEGQYSNYTTKYLNVPVLVSVRPFYSLLKNSKFDFKLLGGVYAGYWTSLDTDGEYPVLGEASVTGERFLRKHKASYDFDKNENHFNRIEYGLQFESKLYYQISKKMSVLVEYSFLYGTSDNTKAQIRKTSRYYYTTHNMGVGLSYKL